MANTFRLAIVQPRTIRPNERANVPRAVTYVREAADQGVKLVAFPECYPGPYAGPVDFSAVEALSAVSREYGIYVAYGYLEPALTQSAAARQQYYNVYEILGPDGSSVLKYRKQIPSPADPQLAGKESIPGDRFAVVETPWARVGTLICWEVFFPELCRTLAMQGADLVLFPTGGVLYDLAPAWRNLIWARATENLIFTASNVNLFGVEKGFAHVCSPEEEIASLLEEGVLIADLDMDRLQSCVRLRTPSPSPRCARPALACGVSTGQVCTVTRPGPAAFRVGRAETWRGAREATRRSQVSEAAAGCCFQLSTAWCAFDKMHRIL